MSLALAAVAFALFSWWFTTGLVLFLNHLKRRTYRWSVLGITCVLLASLVTLPTTAAMHTPLGAFLGFSQALLIWAWLEMTYFMGVVTGPRHAPCPETAQGWKRFLLAVQTSLYHELAVVALGIATILLTWGEPNPVALATYSTLWVMRWSAKLNLFLGVANVNSEWFPEQLQYLTTYIRRRPMNVFFPIAITVATSVLGYTIGALLEAETPYLTTALTLVAALLGLAILEHWFLVLPLQDSVLWQWCLDLARRTQERRAGNGQQRVNPTPQSVVWRSRSNPCA